MNDDLKAYIDGELPPDAAERLRLALASDVTFAEEAEEFRLLSAALRSLPQPEPVGQAETLAALKQRPASLVRGWSFALASCAAVLFVATWVSNNPSRGTWQPAEFNTRPAAPAPEVEVQIPRARREAFTKFIHERGGMVRPDGDFVRAFYNSELQGELTRRFSLPEDTSWTAQGLRIRFTP